MKKLNNHKKSLLGVAVMSVTLGLAACSHDNPLTTQSQAATVDFLIAASTAAEKELHFQVLHYGSAYGACMTQKFRYQADCPALVAAMVNYAQDTNGPFKSITVEDLNNSKAFESIQSAYQTKNFNSLD